jgi:hypothetical protein
MARGPRLIMRDNTFVNCRTGVRARGDVEISSERDQFHNVKTAFDLEEAHPPRELIDATLKLIEDQHRTTGKLPTEQDAERAAAASGLKKWFADQSINIVSLGVALLALYLGK